MAAGAVQPCVRGEVRAAASDQMPEHKFRLRDDGVKTSACRGGASLRVAFLIIGLNLP